jgi:hypothetical protein
MKYFLLAALLLVACNPDNVQFDNESPSFVDPGTDSYVDRGIPTTPAEPAVLNESHEDFVPPPNTTNSTVNEDETTRFANRDIVRLWVWNDRGSQQVLMAEGTGISIAKMKTSVSVVAVGRDNEGGEVKLIVNGKSSPVLHEREEAKVGDSWVFISEIILQSE